METELLPGEEVHDLHLNGLRIIQKQGGFRFGMDAVLLADFARIRGGDTVADFGTGEGVLPLLLRGRGKGAVYEAFEIQEEMAELARRNFALNALAGRVWTAPAERAWEQLGQHSVNAVICNPPYGRSGTTVVNPDERRATARHQGPEGILPWLKSAERILRGNGRLALIYPAGELPELLASLNSCHLTPKRLRLIHPRADRPAKLALIDAVKGARPHLEAEPPLIVFDAENRWTDEVRRIYHMQADGEA